MPITGISGGVPLLSFSELGDIPAMYKQAQKERTLRDIGKGLADGSLDYKTAAGKVAELGDINATLSFLKMGGEQDAMKNFQSTFAQPSPQSSPQPSLEPTQTLSNLGTPAASLEPRGIRNNNPMNLEASSFTQAQPGYSGSDGRFGQFATPDQGLKAADTLLANYANKGINTISGVISRWAPSSDGNNTANYAQFVAQKAGIPADQPINLNDPQTRARILPAMAEFENGRKVQMAGGAIPQQTAQAPLQSTQPLAMPDAAQNPARAQIGKLMGVIADPRLPAGAKDAAKVMLEHYLKQTDLPPDQKDYILYRSQGGQLPFLDYQIKLKQAGATAITNDMRGENTYSQTMGKEMAGLNLEIPKAAISARGKIATLDRIGQLLSDPNIYTGAAGGAVLELKRAAKAIGVDVGNVGPAEAVRAISNQFALEMRNPAGGAGMPGAMSDKDREFLQQIVPGLGNNPQGNAIIIDYMKRVAKRSVDVEAQRRAYVSKHGKLDEGFFTHLADWSDAHPVFPEADKIAPPQAPAPPSQPGQVAPQAQQFKEGQTATNPQTGEKIIFRNGAFIPAQGL